MKKKYLFSNQSATAYFSLCLLGFAGHTHADDILKWDITGATGATGSDPASPGVLGVLGSGFIGGGTGGNSTSPGNTWNRRFTDPSATFAEAQTLGNYFSFDTTAETGFTVEIDGISNLEFRRTTALTEFAEIGLFYSTDGTTFTQTGTTITLPNNDPTSAAAAFSSDLATTPLTMAGGETINWRIVVTNQGDSRLGIVKTGTEDVVITGTSTPDIASKNLLFTGAGGNDWNTTPSNTNWADTDNANAATPFSTFDNVTFGSAATVNVDLGGVDPGTMVVNATSGIVDISGGSINGLSLAKSGDSTLIMDGFNAFSGGVTIEGGTLTAADEVGLGDGGIFIDGSTLNTTADVFTMINIMSIGSAGATLDTDDDVTFTESFSAIDAGIEESFQVVKTGPGILTLTRSGITAFGAQSNVGAIGTSFEFDILEGGVIFSGNGSRYLGNECNWEAPVTLDGGTVMLHGSSITGAGVIDVISNSNLRSRFNRGTCTVGTAITLNSDLTTDIQTGDSNLIISGAIGGTGNFIKEGNGQVTLSGDNTFTGVTTLTSGTLLIDGDSSAATGAITVATAVGGERPGRLGGNGQSGAAVTMQTETELTMTISDWATGAGAGYTDLLVDSLAITNPITVVVETNGLANFTETGATFTFLNTSNGITGFDSAQTTLDIVDFAGTGTWSIAQVSNALVLTYTAAGADDYGTWASGFGLTGGPTDDDDSDGVNNETEYAFGLDPTSAGSLNAIGDVLDAGTGEFSYTRRDTALTGLTYTYEYSTTLESANWMPMTPTSESGDNVSPVETVTVTVPTGLASDGKLFVRVTAQ